jgi:hypothetical protein
MADLAACVALPFGMMGSHNVYEHHVEKRDMEYGENPGLWNATLSTFPAGPKCPMTKAIAG